MKTLRIAITPGEPAGIGPDLCLQLLDALSRGDVQLSDTELVIIADPRLMRERATALGLPPALLDETTLPVSLHPVAMAGRDRPGKPDPTNARYILETLETAVQGCLDGGFDAMVTGPVHKAAINEAGIPFTGHTEFLAQQCGVERTVMMLATEGLRVALATTHLPLKEVPAALTAPSLETTLDILHRDLHQRFGLADPVIAVCGLNPHAGEGGHLGREEIDVIGPVLEGRRQQGMTLRGPLPADTLFTPRVLEGCDAVLAMYHDQGLPVLKFKGFGKAVNITLGLPIIRTSVDHGTALDIAGTGRADTGSLIYALHTAITMART